VPTLVVEDLSVHEWPPPWSAERVDAVLATLEDLRSARVPTVLGPSPQRELFDPMQGWAAIRADPVGAIALGVFDLGWLSRTGSVLETAAAEAVLSGTTLVHGDVRSDNLCIRGSRAVLVDWNLACRGSDTFDLASWLPSLHHEGGPEPWTLLPGHGEVAALLAGFFLEHARRAPIPQAPHVRPLQRDQGVVALRWACHELGIPDPSDA
jgi:aminoglycoside phosphotransferase (APT) family kinase protein